MFAHNLSRSVSFLTNSVKMISFLLKGGEEDEKFVIYSDDDFGFSVVHRQWGQRTVLLVIPPILPLGGVGGDEG